jgi:hypothetical protein
MNAMLLLFFPFTVCDGKLAKYPTKVIDPGDRFFAGVNVAGETNLSLPINDIDIGPQSVTLIRDLKGFFLQNDTKMPLGDSG